MTAFIKLEQVSKSFGSLTVVDRLDLEIAKGEFVSLLGPSGSGKTTILMMLAGFEALSAGALWLEGRRIDHLAAHQRNMGVVFQNYALFPHMTVAENVAFPLMMRGTPRAEIATRVERALDMVKLAELRDRKPAQLSGGQQQRVALTRALVFEPTVVLMDEPLGALDKQLREHMQLEIKHLHQTLGITVVYVTHDQGEALTMSDRIAVFNDGRIQQLATPDDLYERPANSFVAQFIGENNKISGTVVAVNGGSCQVEVEGGGRVEALPVAVQAVGSPTTLSLRPERVRINPGNGACGNVFTARVEELIYLGDHTRVRTSVCGSSEFVIKVPNAEGVPDLQPGSTISVGWKKEDCRALDAF